MKTMISTLFLTAAFPSFALDCSWLKDTLTSSGNPIYKKPSDIAIRKAALMHMASVSAAECLYPELEYERPISNTSLNNDSISIRDISIYRWGNWELQAMTIQGPSNSELKSSSFTNKDTSNETPSRSGRYAQIVSVREIANQ